MPNRLSIAELARRLGARELSSRESRRHAWIGEAVDGVLRAFISFDAKDALRQADEADQALRAGSGPVALCWGSRLPLRTCLLSRVNR